MRTNRPKVLGLGRCRHMLNLAETYERAAASVWFVQQLQCPLYPKSEHVQCNRPCLLWAKSGHQIRDIMFNYDRVLGARPPAPFSLQRHQPGTANVSSPWRRQE